jgi:hypothetical protein
MESLVTISLAGYIVQFVEFGAKLLKEAREFHKAKDGSSSISREIKTIVEDIKYQSGRIRHSCSQIRRSSFLPKKKIGFEQLTLQCESFADELLKLLKKLEIKPEDQKRNGPALSRQ